jgi:hypothetical protein
MFPSYKYGCFPLVLAYNSGGLDMEPSCWVR